MTTPNDPVLEQLRQLPSLDSARAEHLRALARTELWRAVHQSKWSAMWNSVLEPVLVAAVVIVYAGWGLLTVRSLSG